MENKLRVSTSTNICSHVLWKQEVYSGEDAIRLIADAGYGSIDLDLTFWRHETDHMAADGWRHWLHRQIDAAQKAGIPFYQAHGHFFSLDHCELLTQEEQRRREMLLLRDIEACGLAGVKWIVLHPQSYSDDVWYSRSLSMERNLEMFKRFGDAAVKHGVGIAIENMFIHSGVPACFAASADDLVELVDTLGDDRVFGICWDTGHGNLNKLDQVAALRQVGKRLKALHINDNKGQTDDHILPYHGTILWEPFMKALSEIGYDGDFTYEIHNFSKGFDRGFHQEAVRFARVLGEYMVSLM